VLLCYRVPREPSTPRIAIWRKLKRLGVAQIGDGVVALPADARTREQLEWVAEDVVQAGGWAMLWTARPGTVADERRLAEQMAAARATEYARVRDQAVQAVDGGLAALRRLRGELRQIERRDFFPPPERALARAAVEALAARAGADREPA
jgi:ChrB-like protein